MIKRERGTKRERANDAALVAGVALAADPIIDAAWGAAPPKAH